MMLYERYWDGLYRFAFGRTKDKEVTEELMQNLWIKILENTESIQTNHEESAKGYLLKYLHYRVIDYFNSYKTLPSTLRIDDAENSIDITDADYFEILEEHDISALFNMIDEVVSHLPVTEQKIYDLRIRKNLSVDETAEILGLSSKTVSNKLSKAIGEIREQLTPEYKSSKKLISLLVLMEMLVS
ncbi:RNA polymerase sigma factor [Chryseobacterium indoltheticum]|uniref:RNA polymerase sigma factor n=1 Tax=Chryseobacterium indoltheticum TaxID=254 RepID=UPI003F491E6B